MERSNDIRKTSESAGTSMFLFRAGDFTYLLIHKTLPKKFKNILFSILIVTHLAEEQSQEGIFCLSFLHLFWKSMHLCTINMRFSLIHFLSLLSFFRR